MKADDYNPEFINLIDVPALPRNPGRVWKERLDALAPDKAARLVYNNRQRAHQVTAVIRRAARFWKVSIHTRIIHEEPAIHDVEGWIVYYWKKEVK